VKRGYLLRWVKGPYRRLAPAVGVVSKGYFQEIDPEELRRLEGLYGKDKVAEAISVLEHTYALSTRKPECPVAVLKAVLKRGELRYPPGYKGPNNAKQNPVSQAQQKLSNMKLSARTLLLQRAYHYLVSKGLSHDQATERARALALSWLMAQQQARSPEGHGENGTDRNPPGGAGEGRDTS